MHNERTDVPLSDSFAYAYSILRTQGPLFDATPTI